MSEIKELQKKKRKLEKVRDNVGMLVHGSIIVRDIKTVEITIDFPKLKDNKLKELLKINEILFTVKAA